MLAQSETGKTCGVARPLLASLLLLPPTEQLHTNAQPRPATSCRGDESQSENSPDIATAPHPRKSEEHPQSESDVQGLKKHFREFIVLLLDPKSLDVRMCLYKGREKRINFTFCVRKWPVWDPRFWPQKSPPRKSLCRSLVCVFSPGNEAHKLLSGGRNGRGLGGGQKVYIEKVYVLFPSAIVKLCVAWLRL